MVPCGHLYENTSETHARYCLVFLLWKCSAVVLNLRSTCYWFYRSYFTYKLLWLIMCIRVKSMPGQRIVWKRWAMDRVKTSIWGRVQSYFCTSKNIQQHSSLHHSRMKDSENQWLFFLDLIVSPNRAMREEEPWSFWVRRWTWHPSECLKKSKNGKLPSFLAVLKYKGPNYSKMF